jgi:PAS domain S-box-containing protein
MSQPAGADGVFGQSAQDAAADRVRLAMALAAAGNVGVWDGDLVGGRVYADANFARIYGVDPAAAAAGQRLGHYFGAIHPDDREPARAAMAALLAGTAAEFSHEHRICRDDGGLRWVLAQGRLVRDAAGRPVRLLGLSVDITARKQAEARQNFLLQLLDGLRCLDEPAAMLDLAVTRLGRHLGVARAGYAEISEDQQTMVVLGGYADGVPPLHQVFQMDQFGAGNAAQLRQGLTVAHDDVLADPVHATGAFLRLGTRGVISVPLMRGTLLCATLWVATVRPRHWTPDEITLIEDVAARLRDALARVRAEQALRDANLALEQRVAAAVAERIRAEDALRQAQKMEAIGQLTGGIAHDFNNMLQGISGAVQLMRRRIAAGRPEEAARYVAAAEASIERAAALTHRLLAFSRRQALAPRLVDVAELAGGMADMIRQTVGPAVALELRLAAPCWPVQCDPHQLENALLNLAINARDAMLPAGGTLIVESAQEVLTTRAGAGMSDVEGAGFERVGEFVRLTVRDSGRGMAQDVMAHAFEPFFTTKPVGQGTGLGLSQVYGFVNQSDGVVRLESVVGEGTSVHLYLPRADRDLVPAPSAPAPEAAVGSRGAMVLVVEDEAPIRAVVAEALAELGCRVVLAEDGPSGLRALRESAGALDMLVADVGLPGGLNGRQLADAARELAPGLPVLLITGYAGDALGPGMLPEGMAVLTKPFRLDELVARLSAMLAWGGRRSLLAPS